MKLEEEGGNPLLIYAILGAKERLGSFQTGTKTVLSDVTLPNRDKDCSSRYKVSK
jgi:hypothetical protein